MHRHVLIFFMVAALTVGPAARTLLAQDYQPQSTNPRITSISPKVMATPEEPLPNVKKGNANYWVWAAVGVALVAVAAGGGGGGGGSSSDDGTGAIEVGW